MLPGWCRGLHGSSVPKEGRCRGQSDITNQSYVTQAQCYCGITLWSAMTTRCLRVLADMRPGILVGQVCKLVTRLSFPPDVMYFMHSPLANKGFQTHQKLRTLVPRKPLRPRNLKVDALRRGIAALM